MKTLTILELFNYEPFASEALIPGALGDLPTGAVIAKELERPSTDSKELVDKVNSYYNIEAADYGKAIEIIITQLGCYYQLDEKQDSWVVKDKNPTELYDEMTTSFWRRHE